MSSTKYKFTNQHLINYNSDPQKDYFFDGLAYELKVADEDFEDMKKAFLKWAIRKSQIDNITLKVKCAGLETVLNVLNPNDPVLVKIREERMLKEFK